MRWRAYLVAVGASFAGFFTTLVLVLEFNYPNLDRVGIVGLHPIWVAVAICVAVGVLLALIWPGQWREMAVLSSGVFWGFFGLVFLILLFEGKLDLVPLGQALLALGGATLGTWLGRALSPRKAES